MTDGVVLRGWSPLLGPVFLVGNGLSLGLSVHPLFLLSVPVGILGLVPALRSRTVLDPTGVSVCDGVRTRHLPWEEVEAVVTHGRGGLAMRDGRRIPLPGTVVRPVAPATYAHPRSMQRVHEYARAHGASVALEEAQDPGRAGTATD